MARALIVAALRIELVLSAPAVSYRRVRGYQRGQNCNENANYLLVLPALAMRQP